MTSIKINIWSGLDNQILPLVSSIYFCYKYKKKLLYYCDILESCDLKTQFYLLKIFLYFQIYVKKVNIH